MSTQMKTRISGDILFLRSEGEGEEEKNIFSCVAATDTPVRMYGIREVLTCEDGTVDSKSAVSVLFNHDRNFVVGGIRSVTSGGGEVVVEFEVDANAKMPSGVGVADAVRKKFLRGISVGYDYSRKDAVVTEDEDGTTRVTAKNWELREVSLTPVPADTNAGVRGKQNCACAGDGEESQEDTEMAKEGVAEPAADQLEEAKRENEELRRKAVLAERKAKFIGLAAEYGISADGLDFEKDDFELSRALMERKAESEKTRIDQNQSVDVTADAGDKFRDAVSEMFTRASLPGYKSPQGVDTKDIDSLRGMSPLDLGRRWLQMTGDTRAYSYPRMKLAEKLLGSRSAATTSGDFTTYVLLDSANKIVLNAFTGAAVNISYPIWTYRREVPDFKAFHGAGLDQGNLVETPEGVPFEELIKGEAGYSGAVTNWGTAVSLTLQALMNDDLSQFLDILSRTGFLAQRTIEKEVYTQLAAATWTNRTFTGGSLATATLQKASTLLKATTGPASEIIGVTPKYVVCPDGIEQTLRQLLAFSTDNVAPGSRNFYSSLTGITTPFLTTATTASQSTWYLIADQIFQPVVVAFIKGMDTPQIEEADSGLVSARKWKIYLPFDVVVTPTYGAYQATHS